MKRVGFIIGMFTALLTVAATPKADLDGFRKAVAPVLKRACVSCHGPDKQKGKFRVDTLDPDLLNGEDVDWGLEVFGVIGNGEMPPEDAEVHLRMPIGRWWSIGFPARSSRPRAWHAVLRDVRRSVA